MKGKKIVISVLVLVIALAVVGYKMYNKPHVNVASEKADITITANKLFANFSNDEEKANAKYLDKILEVKGVIGKIAKEEKVIINLNTGDDFGSVLCHLSDSSTEKVKDIKEGESIKVKGICTGFLMDVVLVKCEIN